MGSVGAPEIVLPISQIQFPAFVFPKKFHFIIHLYQRVMFRASTTDFVFRHHVSQLPFSI